MQVGTEKDHIRQACCFKIHKNDSERNPVDNVSIRNPRYTEDYSLLNAERLGKLELFLNKRMGILGD